MRPEVLFPLFAPITSLPGVGPRTARLIEAAAGGGRIIDLCWHLPASVIDRRFSPPLADAPEGAIVTRTLMVEEHRPSRNRRSPYRVICRDGGTRVDLVFFHARADYLARILPVGQSRVISGRIERFRGTLQITHPDYVVAPAERDQIPAIEPVYPLTAGLTPKPLLKAVRASLARLPDLPEWQDAALLERHGWPGWKDALLAAHAPESRSDVDAGSLARARLAYDELLANQLALALVRQRLRRRRGRSLQGDGRLRASTEAVLPYRLTGAQVRALDEIAADLAAESRMLRLLQGDVGSGKTIVAWMAMLIAVEAGTQAVLAAPTEILARQPYESLQPLAEAAGIRIARLTGRDKGRARARVLGELAAGELHVLVGTHALFEADVAFKDLGVAVIDEQHRFGVHQRLRLTAKGREPVDVLVMTATPIPRTLALTVYGDMEASRLDEKPPGRTPVDTRTIPLSRLDEVVDGVRRAIAQGARIYWVCPLVEESDVLDVSAAEDRFAHLKARFGSRVGLVHGRLKAAEKDKAMADFAAGRIDILVATTVIEVGVDVPEATVMVIEHAERFGLAQLHQLRGRVGRGTGRSSCLLLYGQPLTATARARLRVLRETDDGFRIAEEDLRLRGAGELLGTRQSGLPAFRIADLEAHAELLDIARDDARLILARDPELEAPRGQALRVLLYLFERDAAVRYLQSG